MATFVRERELVTWYTPFCVRGRWQVVSFQKVLEHAEDRS